MTALPDGTEFIIAERDICGRWEVPSHRIFDRESAEAIVAYETDVVAVPVTPDLAAALEASRRVRAESFDRDSRMIQGHVNRHVARMEVAS